jgi:SAM-dependent methyltransferase
MPKPVSDSAGYLLDNQQQEAGERFAALSELFDPGTFARITALGIGPRWRCWEIGAGGPTVPAWLAEQAGPDGAVLATDIDTAWLPKAAPFEVQRHDIGTDPAPAGEFDLIHARLVLVHVPQRDAALSSMVAALRPGGWLFLQEADPALQPLLSPDETGSAQRLGNRLRTGFRELMAQRGVDLAYGRTLPGRLRAAGLTDVQADAYFPVTGPACTTLERATVNQIRARLVAAGLATDAEIDEHLLNVESGLLDLATAPLVSAWGRRPA